MSFTMYIWAKILPSLLLQLAFPGDHNVATCLQNRWPTESTKQINKGNKLKTEREQLNIFTIITESLPQELLNADYQH